MAADLRYTTADVNYYAKHWAEPNYDTGLDEHHVLLQDPNLEAVFDALVESGEWLRNFADDPEWDGGGITLNFAGHGREGDGALIVPDGEITSSELAKRLATIARLDPAGHSLRVVLMLDSCYSGEFLINFIEHCVQDYSKWSFAVLRL
jgi:hypothetical protein